ncbi:unnamed protein product [Hermetia illucens]|uniref:Hydroxylysine kinase n=2 Tax=Hermetia illucens TaxID=343691 RepID=A0A7R8UEY4_HERIL|nr:unnamed protein product [Hermetia illucens]
MSEVKPNNSEPQSKEVPVEKKEEPASEPQPEKQPLPSLDASGQVLKPGAKIRPEVTTLEVEKLAQRLYGITVFTIKELVSYDDRNFLITEDTNIKNPLITDNCPDGYVLKVLNTHDSKKQDFIDAQSQLMVHMRSQGILCPKPVINVYGKLYSIEIINNEKHIVRLLEFIPGQMFHEIPHTKNLFYQAGEYIAKFDNALKGFKHDAYDNHKTLWMLESVPRLKEFVYVIKDPARAEMVEQVIEAFETHVLSQTDKFEKGIIHGDFNEQNIIVNKPKGRNEYIISGILDFGDTSYSPLVFELAIAMTYMILQGKDLSVGGLVLAGYNSVRLVPEKEQAILMYCVAARLCQSLVLGAYTHSLDPENDYLLITQKVGWEILEKIWADFNRANEIWKETADDYLKQSIK